MYSNPPRHGASIATRILADPQLYAQWKVELKGMADRILTMRQQLYQALQEGERALAAGKARYRMMGQEDTRCMKPACGPGMCMASLLHHELRAVSLPHRSPAPRAICLVLQWEPLGTGATS